MKICICATSGVSLTNFRGELIKSWVRQGHSVVCTSIEPYEQMAEAISKLGASYYQIAGSRVGIGLLEGVKMIREYRKAFKILQPDMCFLYMSKPVAFGGFAAIMQRIGHINVLVNGLENAFYRKGLKDWLVRLVMSFFYWFVGRKSDNVFMQNEDDYHYFISHRITKAVNTSVVNGSGVDMTYFKREPLPQEPVFLMTARLLWSKGIREYLSAISQVKKECPEAKFMLVGGLDENDEALSPSELQKCIEEYEIEYCGYTTDVREYLKKCSVFVLPSYHEGTPRSVLEAMATGRAIITTIAPGCRETVVEGANGFLVPVGDSTLLAQRIVQLAQNAALRTKMAEASYNVCMAKYEVSKINKVLCERMSVS